MTTELSQAIASLRSSFERMAADEDRITAIAKSLRVPIVGRVPFQDVCSNSPLYVKGISKQVME